MGKEYITKKPEWFDIKEYDVVKEYTITDWWQSLHERLFLDYFISSFNNDYENLDKTSSMDDLYCIRKSNILKQFKRMTESKSKHSATSSELSKLTESYSNDTFISEVTSTNWQETYEKTIYIGSGLGG
jgi:hypothetical protein